MGAEGSSLIGHSGAALLRGRAATSTTQIYTHLHRSYLQQTPWA
jgi:site-specific recombinase XerD